RLPRLKHLSNGGGGDVGGGAHEPGAAEGEEREAQQFDAAPHEQLCAAQVQHAGEVFEVFRGLFDADEVVDVAKQARDGLGGDVDRRAARHVVGDDGQIRKLVGDRLVPAVERLLRGARVVGRDDECGVDACVTGG